MAKDLGTQIIEERDALEAPPVAVEKLFESAPLFEGLSAEETGDLAIAKRTTQFRRKISKMSHDGILHVKRIRPHATRSIA
ncbi:hypothetical protein BN77_p10941 [Rhizobium mesoamericanum STM3625]|uniref:Uncharacterized protein n=1 Tax=Rhizobium mesoamericanum STM3625 TaxID=1211777 RepID=K0Q593_9HYPH|nr:hypothetical protein BN77_p10941 [Rhizobium mesoamericanum STM3625]